jgi:high-affinity nickel-transport protein
MELSVAVMLIVLGVMNLSGIQDAIRESRATKRANRSHRPVAWLDKRLAGVHLYQLVRPLVVGIVHGLAGSAALALLVLTTIGSSAWSLLYLLVFGAGTIVGMMLITAAIGIPFASTGKHSSRLSAGLRIAAGLISLGFGLFLAYQIGWGNGLFTGQPQWTPR